MRTTWQVAIVVLCAAFLAGPASGQTDLTSQQRAADLNQLASFYAKNYAPYEWKRDVIGFDLLRLNPWLRDIHRESDLDFQETLVEYVASLDDAHSYISFPSNFSASLPLTVDIYDGKVLIDSINRSLLPTAQYPFGIGDELVAFDGQPAREAIASLRKYSIAANRRSTDRVAAAQLTFRSQQIFPHLGDLPDSAVLTIRLAATGGSSAYSIPWSKRGVPINSAGNVVSPGRHSTREFERTQGRESWPDDDNGFRFPAFGSAAKGAVADDTLPAHMTPLAQFLKAGVDQDRYAVLNFGSKIPVYAPPPGFVLRRGGSSADFFLTGTFIASGFRIGFIRIPNMQPSSAATALQQLDAEIAYFNANTDGLIVDIARNPGGNVVFSESVLQRLIPTPFRTMGYEIRATQFWLAGIAESLTQARLSNAPPQVIQNLQDIFDEIRRAYLNGGRTVPLSLNSTGGLTVNPVSNAYTKPLLVLADEFSASAAEVFIAVIQDNGRGPIFGMRTMGAGGTVLSYNATAYTDSTFTVTSTLMNRGRLIQVPGFPPTPYVENVGVRPDIVQDYMTRTNLMTGGSSYVQAFTNAIVGLIQRSAP